ncbi:transporter, major facilitator family protein [Ostertagia ostertagi]
MKFFSKIPFQISKVHLSMSILFCINLLNYMDRYTIAGKFLSHFVDYYDINDAKGGLLQSIFMLFYMICCPVCGFLGDRYIRKWVMTIGIAVWVLAVFASTYVPKNMFWLFLLLRGIVGVGEASYVITSPSVIADMCSGENRSRMLMLFYFAIPCGSGLGFIIGSYLSALTGDWKWGIRVTAVLGVVCLLAIIFFIQEPERGGVEREGRNVVALVASSYVNDLGSLATNLTFIFSTAGYTALVFVVGTLAWWAPTAMEHSYASKRGLSSTDELDPDIKAQ